MEEIARGSFRHENPPGIQGSGYVVRLLDAALWSFYWTDNFEAAILKTGNPELLH